MTREQASDISFNSSDGISVNDCIPDGWYKWIPVSERMPEDRKIVLVTAYWHETYQVMVGSYFGNGDWWCVPWNNTSEPQQLLKVKAWMPLPQPYKEEQK